jgi:hypothetical protein
MSSSPANSSSVAVYGLSTEGYRLACSIAVKGNKVSLIDESVRMAISLKADIARSYPDVSALREDEPLLDLEPIDSAISNASYVFFAPRIRKIGPDAKSDVSSKFKDAVKSIKKGSSVLYLLPTGINGNNENIQLIEHVTGLSVSDGKDVSYYYMPTNTTPGVGGLEIPLGAVRSKQDNVLAKMLHDPDLRRRISFVDLNSAELSHIIRVLSHYSGMASIFEICKKIPEGAGAGSLIEGAYGDIYIDDVTSGLYDLRVIGSSLDGAGSLMYLVNGSIRGIEGYIKHLIDQIRSTLKQRDLKASRTKVAISWTLDRHEMRGDKMEILGGLESKIKDYIGDVERYQSGTSPSVDIYHADKTTLLLACSKADYEKLHSSLSGGRDFIVMKANPLCQTMQD